MLIYKQFNEIQSQDIIQSIVYIDENSNKYSWDTDAWHQILKNKHNTIELLYWHNKLIGASVWLRNDVAFELLHIVIDKQYQHQGFATKWLNYLCEKFNKNSQIWLEVRQSNLIAQKLYIKCGFSAIAKRKNYYPIYKDNIIIKREDAILMQK